MPAFADPELDLAYNTWERELTHVISPSNVSMPTFAWQNQLVPQCQQLKENVIHSRYFTDIWTYWIKEALEYDTTARGTLS